jgi:hypothetical protein
MLFKRESGVNDQEESEERRKKREVRIGKVRFSFLKVSSGSP